MSLKLVRLFCQLTEEAKRHIDALNEKFGTHFRLEVDLGIVTEADTKSGWSEEETGKSFFNTYFLPLETALEVVWKDAVHRKAITQQVRFFAIVPSRGGASMEVEWGDGVVKLRKDLRGGSCADGGDHRVSVVKDDILAVLEEELLLSQLTPGRRGRQLDISSAEQVGTLSVAG